MGPVYVHNHTGEFDDKHVDNGVLKTAWEILIERTDPRYVAFQVDAFWATDAFDDATGTATAAFINKYPTRVKLMHVKDGINVGAAQPEPDQHAAAARRAPSARVRSTTGRSSPPARARSSTTARSRTARTLTDMVTSLRNLKGRGPTVVPSVLAPADHVPVRRRRHRGRRERRPDHDQEHGRRPAHDHRTSRSPTATPPASQQPGPRGRAPRRLPGRRRRRLHRRRHRSERDLLRQRRLQADEHQHQVGGPSDRRLERRQRDGVHPAQRPEHRPTRPVASAATSDTALSLTLGPPGSFGTFVPAIARTYDTAAAASVVSTAGNATLSVSDPSAAATGKLVNGTFSLSQPLQVNATNAANTTSAFAPLSTTAGTPTNLLTYNGPTAGADNVTIGFRQAIVANEVLRSGNYIEDADLHAVHHAAVGQ